MNKNKLFVNSLVVVAILCGLFAGPLVWYQVSAAPPFTIMPAFATVRLVRTPPATMCVDDTAMIAFEYTITGGNILNSSGVTPAPSGAGLLGTFMAGSSKGDLFPNAWNVYGSDISKGSGMFEAVYTAKTAGEEQITISSAGFSMTGKADTSFDVVDCSRDIEITVQDIETSSAADFKTDFIAKGGLSIDKNGQISGGGSYNYKLGMTYKDLKPGLICETDKSMTGLGTFSIQGIYDLGDLMFNTSFTSFDYPGIAFKCIDDAGRIANNQMVPAGTADLNTTFKVMTTDLVLKYPLRRRYFVFGTHGFITVSVYPRKGGAK